MDAISEVATVFNKHFCMVAGHIGYNDPLWK